MKTKKWMLMVIMVIMVLWCTGCKKEERVTEYESGTVSVDWENVNSALSKYNLEENGYYIGDTYMEEEEEFNTLMISNYDPDDMEAFKQVEYQMTISYGEIMMLGEIEEVVVYEKPMLEISLVDNKSGAYYVAVYDTNGIFVAEEGTWFLDINQDEYLKEKVEESKEMLGLQ